MAEKLSKTAEMVEEEEPSMWESMRGVIFVLGIAAAFTLSFAVLHFHEVSFSSVSCSNAHNVKSVSAATDAQKEKEKNTVGVTEQSFLLPATSRAVAA